MVTGSVHQNIILQVHFKQCKYATEVKMHRLSYNGPELECLPIQGIVYKDQYSHNICNHVP